MHIFWTMTQNVILTVSLDHKASHYFSLISSEDVRLSISSIVLATFTLFSSLTLSVCLGLFP